MSERIELIPCPFCGCTPHDDENEAYSGFHRTTGGYDLRHVCFENYFGNELAVRTVVVSGKTKEHAAARWNRRRKDG